MNRSTFLYATLVAGSAQLFASASVHAQTTIDQNRALAGSINPGDAPGFPVTLNLPGSYKLVGNLVVPAGFKGIVITADGVTLDLNGFTVSGPITCDVSKVPECTGSNTGTHGIEIVGARTVVRNGSVRGFDGDGVHLSAMLDVVDNLVIDSNSGSGIHVEPAAVGLFGYSATRISHTMVTQNRMNGITVSQGFAVNVVDSVASRNGRCGIVLVAGSLSDVTLIYNGTFGLSAGSAVLMSRSRFQFNKQGTISGPAHSGGGNVDDSGVVF